MCASGGQHLAGREEGARGKAVGRKTQAHAQDAAAAEQRTRRGRRCGRTSSKRAEARARPQRVSGARGNVPRKICFDGRGQRSAASWPVPCCACALSRLGAGAPGRVAGGSRGPRRPLPAAGVPQRRVLRLGRARSSCRQASRLVLPAGPAQPERPEVQQRNVELWHEALNRACCAPAALGLAAADGGDRRARQRRVARSVIRMHLKNVDRRHARGALRSRAAASLLFCCGAAPSFPPPPQSPTRAAARRSAHQLAQGAERAGGRGLFGHWAWPAPARPNVPVPVRAHAVRWRASAISGAAAVRGDAPMPAGGPPGQAGRGVLTPKNQAGSRARPGGGGGRAGARAAGRRNCRLVCRARGAPAAASHRGKGGGSAELRAARHRATPRGGRAAGAPGASAPAILQAAAIRHAPMPRLRAWTQGTHKP